MGGEVCVGIKHNGVETIMNAWTNGVGWFLMQPTFRDGGAMYKLYIERAKRTNKWPKSVLVDEINPSEYGVTLIDLDHKDCYSQQGYDTPGQLRLTTPCNSDDTTLLFELVRLGHLTHFTVQQRNPHMDVAKPPTVEVLTAILSKQLVGFVAHLHPLQLNVTWYNKPITGEGDWGGLKYWAEARGWQSKFATPKWPPKEE